MYTNVIHLIGCRIGFQAQHDTLHAVGAGKIGRSRESHSFYETTYSYAPNSPNHEKLLGISSTFR